MSIRSSCLIALFKSSAGLLIFCLLILSVKAKVVLKSPTTSMAWFVSPINSVSFASCYLKLCFYMHKYSGLYVLLMIPLSS